MDHFAGLDVSVKETTRFCAFSYSIGEPCGRSVHVSMYFKGSLPV